jgi:hypothetical protein
MSQTFTFHNSTPESFSQKISYQEEIRSTQPSKNHDFVINDPLENEVNDKFNSSNYKVNSDRDTPSVMSSSRAKLEMDDDDRNFDGAPKIEFPNKSVSGIFKKLFNPIKDHLFNKMNNRRYARCEKRKTKEGGRGRPSKYSENDPMYTRNRKYYTKRWELNFTLTQFYTFLALYFGMLTIKYPNVKDYFETPSVNKIHGSYFFNSRMKYHTFTEMFNSIDGDVDFLLDESNRSFQNSWDPSYYLSLDETMLFCKIRDNPHHVFIKRKPCPHGIKFYTMCCDSTYLWKFRMCRRSTQGPIDKILFRTPKDKYEKIFDVKKTYM